MKAAEHVSRILSAIDRRIIYTAVLLATLLPLLVHFSQPIYITKEARDLYEWVENIPDSSTILLTFDYYPSTVAEVEPMSVAAVEQCWRKHLKLISMSTVGLGGPNIAERVLRKMAREWGGGDSSRQKVYGIDYINLGYKANYRAVVLGMGTSFRNIFPTDYGGVPLDSFPIMKGVDSYHDVAFLFIISDNGIVDDWVQIANRRFGLPLGAGVTAVMAPKFYAYVQSGQMVGMLGGMKGAAEYEILVGHKGQANLFMGPQSAVHLMIILFIVLGNVAYFLGKRR